MVGWSKFGDRPIFDVVTGVSTGALIARRSGVGRAAADRLPGPAVASASVPGLFPPMLIAADDTSAGAAEAHADGCVSTARFMPPRSMTSSRPESSVRPAGFHLMVNGNLNPPHRRTRAGAVSIMMRALDTMGGANTRAKVAAFEVLAEGAGAGVACAAIPDDRPANPFNFRPSNLRTLFELGYAQAARGKAFRRRGPLDERLRGSWQGARQRAERLGRWGARATPVALSGSCV